MNAKELSEYIGARALFRQGALEIPVRITNARTQWGRVHFEITPINGTGTAWVEESRLTVSADAKKAQG